MKGLLIFQVADACDQGSPWFLDLCFQMKCVFITKQLNIYKKPRISVLLT